MPRTLQYVVSKGVTRRVATLRSIAGLACVTANIGCEQPGPVKESPCTLEGLTAEPVNGVLNISYVGWLGELPTVPFVVGVSNVVSVGLDLQGCGYAGDDWWWLDTSFQFPEGNQPPMIFDTTEHDAAYPRASLVNCTRGDPSSCSRSWFNGDLSPTIASGTLDVYDVTQRRFKGHYSLQNIGDSSLDHGTFSLDADFAW